MVIILLERIFIFIINIIKIGFKDFKSYLFFVSGFECWILGFAGLGFVVF